MEIVLNHTKSKYLEIFSLLNVDNSQETFKKFSSMKGPLEAKIYSVNETISCQQLSKLIFVPYAFTQTIEIRY